MVALIGLAICFIICLVRAINLDIENRKLKCQLKEKEIALLDIAYTITHKLEQLDQDQGCSDPSTDQAANEKVKAVGRKTGTPGNSQGEIMQKVSLNPTFEPDKRVVVRLSPAQIKLVNRLREGAIIQHVDPTGLLKPHYTQYGKPHKPIDFNTYFVLKKMGIVTSFKSGTDKVSYGLTNPGIKINDKGRGNMNQIRLTPAQTRLVARLKKGAILSIMMETPRITRVKSMIAEHYYQHGHKVPTVKFNVAFALYSKEVIDMNPGIGKVTQVYRLVDRKIKVNEKGEATWKTNR